MNTLNVLVIYQGSMTTAKCLLSLPNEHFERFEHSVFWPFVLYGGTIVSFCKVVFKVFKVFIWQ